MVPVAFIELPDEVLARVFVQLSPVQLSWVEQVCRRARVVVAEHQLWRQHCLSAHPAIVAAAADVDDSRIPSFRTTGGTPDPSAAGSSSGAAGEASAAVTAPAARRSAFFKHLHFRLTAAPARESLIADALAATSTDHAQEGVGNVLDPKSRTLNLVCYWSSRGSEDAGSSEALAFGLAHPLCLVTEVQLRPFMAFFQWGSPIYAPQALRVRFGGASTFTPDGLPIPLSEAREAANLEVRDNPPPPVSAAVPAVPAGAGVGAQGAAAAAGGAAGGDFPAQQAQQAQAQAQQPAAQQQEQQHARQRQGPWEWQSPAYVVEPRDELQRFPIPPTLCVGGYLRLELMGKRQRQAADDAYYACICYARAVGVPIYDFHLQWTGHGPGRLVYITPDPLAVVGGLAAVSEAGRLAQAAMDDDEDIEDVYSSGESGDEMEESSSEDEDEGGNPLQGVAADSEEEEWQPGGDAGAY